MRKDEIKQKCRKAYIVTENNHIFDGQAGVETTGATLYKRYSDALECAKNRDYLHRNMEYNKTKPPTAYKVHSVYLVPAKKIDD